ncbi:MAG: PorP/SprF family type IX secretion system membrane protein [Bacteroidetes bacterium]|nr:PorP/SprF family type IX secretion system membrane protein [Bacteroidota bacterium]
MKKNYFIIFILVAKNIFCQDIHLTQYFIAPQTINPAAFGVINSFEAGLQHKSQWNAFTKGFTTYSAFINKQITAKTTENKGYFSAGLNFGYDRSGDGNLTTIGGCLPLNYSLKLNDHQFLTSGVSIGFAQKSITSLNQTWGSQFDGFNYNSSLASENQAQQSVTALDLGTGIALINKKNGKKFAMNTEPSNTLGFSVAHINKPNYSFYKNSNERMLMRFNLYESFNYSFEGSRYSISPSLMLQYQGRATEAILGAMIHYRSGTDSYITGLKKTSVIGFGAYYRAKDAFALNAFFEVKKIIFGASYDINTSTLQKTSKSKGGLELFIKIKNASHLYKGFGKW